jgi:hypothetical protein
MRRAISALCVAAVFCAFGGLLSGAARAGKLPAGSLQTLGGSAPGHHPQKTL